MVLIKISIRGITMIIKFSNLLDGMNDILSNTSAMYDFTEFMEEDHKFEYLSSLEQVELSMKTLETKIQELKEDLMEIIND